MAKQQETANRKLKRAGLALFAGFMLFAPPGTLIVLALLLAPIFGKTGILIFSGAALLARAGLWLRRRAAQRTKRS
jgi:hypothetical protein